MPIHPLTRFICVCTKVCQCQTTSDNHFADIWPCVITLSTHPVDFTPANTIYSQAAVSSTKFLACGQAVFVVARTLLSATSTTFQHSRSTTEQPHGQQRDSQSLKGEALACRLLIHRVDQRFPQFHSKSIRFHSASLGTFFTQLQENARFRPTSRPRLAEVQLLFVCR